MILKLCVVGDDGIGKEAYIKLFLSKTFISKDKGTRYTIGVDLYNENISINTDRGMIDCNIQLWELTGEERYRFLYPKFLKGTAGILLFFDLAKRESFLHLADWIKLIEESTKKEREGRKRKGKKEIPILLVGNKSDPEKFAVSPKELDDFISKYKTPYIETSTITKEGIADSFYCITSLIAGVDIHSEYFLSEKIIYRPSIIPASTTPSSSTLTPQDLLNLSQKIIMLEKKLDYIKIKEERAIPLEKDAQIKPDTLFYKNQVPEERPVEEKARESLDVGHEVFICYSSKDKVVADATCHSLEQQGIKCWIAPRDVTTGSYASSIVEAIETSKLVVLIFTNSANFSNHVKRELELAVSNGITIQPIRTEAVEPISELKYYLSSMHWLDALTPPLEDHLSKLAKLVSQLL